MPVQYLRRLTSPEHSEDTSRYLGQLLASMAGAVNAGGFLAAKQYTSHMSGIVSAIADDLVLGDVVLVFTGLTSLLTFLCDAARTAVLVNWGRRHSARSEFALPLILKAALLLLFGLIGTALGQYRVMFVPATVALLCFLTGPQNAIVTKISKTEIRTTHVTDLATDIGIEISRALHQSHGHHSLPAVVANQPKLRLLASLLGIFFMGDVVDALGSKHLGCIATISLVSILMLLAVMPVVDDLLTCRQWRTGTARRLVARHIPHNDRDTIRTACMRNAERLASWRVK